MENVTNDRATRWSKVFTFLIVAFPVLDIYAVGMKGISIGSLLLSAALVGIGINFLTKKHSVKWNPYYAFFYYGIFISFFTILIHNDFSVSDVIVRLTYFLFYTLLIFMPSKYDFNINYAGKIYMTIGLIAGLFLLLQYICFFGMGYMLVGLIPGMPLNYSITDYSDWIDKYNNMYLAVFRPTSFFPEPASFAQFMTPLLVMTLFSKIGENRRLLKAAFISLVMVLSTSTNGIIFSAFAWGGIYFIGTFLELNADIFLF